MENEQVMVGTRTYIEKHAVPIAIVIAGFMIAVSLYSSRTSANDVRSPELSAQVTQLENEVIPAKGVELPVAWGDLGKKLVDAGAIDPDKMKALYEDRGGFPAEYRKLLEQGGNGKIVMTRENAGYLLNLLWALGLANKNPILEDKTEMMNPAYGGAENFASTGGWTLSKGDSMEHYNAYSLVVLTADQQKLIDEVSRNIYRPCCDNSVHFPDCNHGMAMLGLLELMASRGVSEKDMYRVALAVNSYWFPDTYITIATYMKQEGVEWKDVNPKEILGSSYSSASGYARIASKVSLPQQQQGGSGCGIDSGGAVSVPQQQQSGCGI